MNTLLLTLFLLLGSTNFNTKITQLKRMEQDTASAKFWKRRAEEFEARATAATWDALKHKAIGEKKAAEVEELKKMLEECRTKKNE